MAAVCYECDNNPDIQSVKADLQALDSIAGM